MKAISRWQWCCCAESVQVITAGIDFVLSGGETKVLSVMITADDAGFHLHTTNDSNLTTTDTQISHHALGQNNFSISIYLSV